MYVFAGYFRFFLLLCCLGSMVRLGAQGVSPLGDTVRITASRPQLLSPGHRRVALDSTVLQAMQGQSLADVLSLHSDVFIKSYGLGSLATTSLRGGGASHTAIVWNGISLQSPMNGQLDLALFPAFLLDEVSIQYGGSAALYGSGAVGGAIHLDNQTAFGRGLRAGLHLQGGSYGQRQAGGDIGYSHGRWLSRTRFYGRQAENDFLLPNEQRQAHAALEQRGLLQENALKINDRQQLRLWLWTQQSERELPAPFDVGPSAATQADRHLRLASEWQREGKRLDLYVRGAYLREGLTYADSLAGIFSENESRRFQLEGESYWQLFPAHRLQVGASYTHQAALATGYGAQQPQQQQMALFASWRYAHPLQRWEAVLSLRQAWIHESGDELSGVAETYADWGGVPFVPSLSVRARLLPWLQAQGQAGRTFRLPTFNDRYWSPGGQPGLRPEQGWHQEVGLEGAWQHAAWNTQLHLSAFSQQIDDWILWRPGPAYWYPENLRTVWSRGLEAEGRLTTQGSDWQGQLRLAYTYTRATITATTGPRDLSQGKQLIYTPEHQGRLSLRGQWKAFSLHYTHTFTGYRYTTSDNSAFLPGFDLGALYLQHRWQGPRWQLRSSLRCDNLWGRSYQVIAARPMPRQVLSLGLDVVFAGSSLP